MKELFRLYDAKADRIFELTLIGTATGYVEGVAKGDKHIKTAGYLDSRYKGKERFKLLQFTGVYDKLGDPIFEGHIVSAGKELYEVIREGHLFNLKDYFEPSSDYPTDAFSEGLFTIIGTIYENKEIAKMVKGAKQNDAI